MQILILFISLRVWKYGLTHASRAEIRIFTCEEGALDQMSKNFQVYFIHINFFKKPNKKFYNRAKDATMFFDALLSTCAKKWKLKNGPRLPTLPYDLTQTD